MRKNRPSRTAYKVALSLVTLGVKPGLEDILPPGIVSATEKMLVASGAAGARTVRWAGSPRMLSVYEAFDWMLPGQFEAFAYRKAFCERQAREAIDLGGRQVLVLGAGYDTLCWRLAPEFPGVNFFEIDHPATARLKGRGIEALGKRENLCLIAADLGQQKLVYVLTAAQSWDQKAQTVIIAEGLVMYLPPDSVGEMFRQSARIVGADSRIVFSYIPTGPDGRPIAGPCTGLMLWLQKMVGEPWLWSACPDQLGSYLKTAGWGKTRDSEVATCKYGVEYFAVAQK